MKYTKREFEKLLKDKLMSECNVTIDAASADQIYRCLAMITRQIMSDRQKQYQSKVLGEGKKQVYYLCMEFLMGRSLRTSLFNLGLNEVAESVLADADVKIDTIYEQEPDAGLGNGGLGRLAACYLDGMATDCIPGTGYSILYEYGIFKQKIVDGWQQETADNWLPGGQVWIKSHPDQAQEIRFDGQAIETWEGKSVSFEQEANPEIKPFQSFVLTDAKTLSTLRSLRIGDGVVTGNQTIEPVDGYYVTTDRGAIVIHTPEPMDVVVIRMNGKVAYRGEVTDGQRIMVSSGIYAVNGQLVRVK